MVNPELHIARALSPSVGTPHLTINHDVAGDSDSTNAFEGPEKLLEVWFAASASSLPPSARPDGLKSVPAATWVGMLDLVNCKILSVLKSDTIDAYLLSESSLFVFPHKIILKTCGTTTLLLGLQRMLRIAAVDAGFPFHNAESIDEIRAAATPYRVFYSRKNFLFPDKQRGPHKSWDSEVKYLDDMFEGGSAYLVGKMNGDHWYLYITSASQALTPPRTPDEKATSPITSRIPAGAVPCFPCPPEEMNDETLEILMTDLDPENAKQFYMSHASAVASDKQAAQARNALQQAADTPAPVSGQGNEEPGIDVFSNAIDSDLLEPMLGVTEALTTEGHALGTVVSETCGLSEVYPLSEHPDARIDAYLFSPCGFSANGVVPALKVLDESSTTKSNAAHYFTVHVTPEPNCSFASFETNVPGGQAGRTTTEIIEHVVDIFKPGRFSVTLFEAKDKAQNADRESDEQSSVLTTQRVVHPVRGYRRMDRIVHDFEDYDLVFRYYERDDWAGRGGARVGEVQI